MARASVADIANKAVAGDTTGAPKINKLAGILVEPSFGFLIKIKPALASAAVTSAAARGASQPPQLLQM